jgi:hypothetical protein
MQEKDKSSGKFIILLETALTGHSWGSIMTKEWTLMVPLSS